jgi:hypothetical protein
MADGLYNVKAVRTVSVLLLLLLLLLWSSLLLTLPLIYCNYYYFHYSLISTCFCSEDLNLSRYTYYVYYFPSDTTVLMETGGLCTLMSIRLY